MILLLLSSWNTTHPLFIAGIILLIFQAAVILYLILHRIRKKEQFNPDNNSVTGIWNLQKFSREADNLLLNADKVYAILHFDIARFRYINDNFGYKTADCILRVFATTLKSSFCKEDGICCTLWADQHAAMVEYTTKEALEERIMEFDRSFREKALHICDFIYIIKAGICLSEFDGKRILDIRDLLRFSNNALNTITDPYKTEFVWYTHRLAEEGKLESKLDKELTNALHTRKFVPYFQPKYDLFTGEVIGAEALVRWIHDDRGVINPIRFLPGLEKSGFIVDVDLYVFEEVCKQMRIWITKGLHIVPISCNFSRLHIQNTAFPMQLKQIVDKYALPPDLIDIELKESVAIEWMTMIDHHLQSLKDMGFHTSIDGYGAGYLSLSILRHENVDMIKLDKDFMKSDHFDDKDRKILSSIIRLAQTLNISVICEGVESKEQIDFLKLIGCRKAQGYFYGRPVPARDFEVCLSPHCAKEIV